MPKYVDLTCWGRDGNLKQVVFNLDDLDRDLV